MPAGAKYGPHNIIVFDDYDDGLKYAKEVNKPIMLDFTGYACVNCRKMENNVWSDPKILKILNNNVVVISLFVDDKRVMPATAQIKSKLTDPVLLTSIPPKLLSLVSKYVTYILLGLNVYVCADSLLPKKQIIIKQKMIEYLN